MIRLFKAFLFKISKDITFRITLIIGAGLALLMTGIYVGLQYGLFALDDVDAEVGFKFISGQGMLVSSMSPAQNYGLAIPINLITYTCLEFSQGTIRNKIIAGHSKFKIYTSLFFSGLIFAFALLGTYILICTGLGSIFGGFNLDDMVYMTYGFTQMSVEYLIKMIIICIVTYISIVSFVVFITTAFRNVGPCIPIVIIPIMICYIGGMIVSMISLMNAPDPETGEMLFDLSGLENTFRIVDPLYAIGSYETNPDTGAMQMSNYTFIAGIVNNLVYTGIFFLAGSVLFKKRDVK